MLLDDSIDAETVSQGLLPRLDEPRNAPADDLERPDHLGWACLPICAVIAVLLIHVDAYHLGKPVNWLSEVVAGGLRVIGGLIGFMWDKTSGEEGLIGKSILRNANADANSLC